jgi:hypothetical protein
MITALKLTVGKITRAALGSIAKMAAPLLGIAQPTAPATLPANVIPMSTSAPRAAATMPWTYAYDPTQGVS